MKLTFDLADWRQCYWDTPLNCPESYENRMRLDPGVAVMTKDNLRCGRVSKRDPEGECIVIGWGWDNTPEEKFVWRGSFKEFQETWAID